MFAGAIVMWSGTTLPDGWVFCDGTSGTPDLRNKFIVGAGNAYTPGNTGGEATNALATHTHVVNNHTHTASVTTGAPSLTTTYPTGASSVSSSAHTHSGTGNLVVGTTASGNNSVAMNIPNEPPYYTLAFIMKT